MQLTVRQQILELLEDQSFSAKDLSKAVKIKEKEVYEHLTHIERSIKSQKKKLRVEPFYCIPCGYIFKDRKRLSKPSRCPQCKKGQIEAATFKIE